MWRSFGRTRCRSIDTVGARPKRQAPMSRAGQTARKFQRGCRCRKRPRTRCPSPNAAGRSTWRSARAVPTRERSYGRRRGSRRVQGFRNRRRKLAFGTLPNWSAVRVCVPRAISYVAQPDVPNTGSVVQFGIRQVLAWRAVARFTNASSRQCCEETNSRRQKFTNR